MVKVQKPKAKSLDKAPTTPGIIKKNKKAPKPAKKQSGAAVLAVENTPPVVIEKKVKKEKAAPVEVKSVAKKAKQTKVKSNVVKSEKNNVAPAKKNKKDQPELSAASPSKKDKNSKFAAGKVQKLKNKKPNKQALAKQVKSVKEAEVFEPLPFDEEAFKQVVNVENITKLVKALKTVVEQEVAEKKTSIFSDYQYFLDICCFKIANCPKRLVKLFLKHSLGDSENDVLIVVPDLQRGAKVEYDSTIQHYEDLFRELDVQGLTIVPFNKLRNEYKTFESARKLANSYDYFLVDGRIAGLVNGFLGKVFQKPRTTFHSVNLQAKHQIKKNIDKALHRTSFKQFSKGNMVSMPVGSHKLTPLQVAENIDYVASQLNTVYAGGLGNVRKMVLKIDIVGTTSVPIYISTAAPPEAVPFVVGIREKRMIKLKREANEVLSKFTMTKDGQIIRLNKEQVERKRKIKEAHAALSALDGDVKPEQAADEDVASSAEEVASANEDEENVSAEEEVEEVEPPKKIAKKQKKVKQQLAVKQLEVESAEEQEEEEEIVAPKKKANKAKNVKNVKKANVEKVQKIDKKTKQAKVDKTEKIVKKKKGAKKSA